MSLCIIRFCREQAIEHDFNDGTPISSDTVRQAVTAVLLENNLKHVADYYNPPPAEEQTIYVWVDESGVRNYVNDLDFVPMRYRDAVTTLGAE